MANDKKRAERRALRQKRAMLEKERADDELEIEEEPELVGDPSDTSWLTEKSYDEDGTYPSPAMAGPKSWEELDAAREAREKAYKIQGAAWDVNDLVWNIIHDGEMDPDTKGEAISKIGAGFSGRVKKIMGDKDKMEKSVAVATPDDEMDALYLESIIAKDSRHTPVTEKIVDFISKAKLTAAAEEKLSDDEFALVKDVDGKKVRKYPIHDKSHVRNALARAAQMLKESGEAAADARAALPKIRAAAKRMGIGTVEKSASSVLVEKDNSGRWRAVMWPTNNFKDLDGEILTEKAHLDYVEWVNKNMDLAPVFVTWHKPETVRKNQVDFVGYQDGFLVLSAPLEDDEAAGLMRVMKKCDVGMSHGTIVLKRESGNPKNVEKYVMVEASDLPLVKAANPFTDFAIVTKEAAMDMKAYLTTLLGEEKALAVLEKTGIKQASLRQAGVQEKESKEEAAPVAPAVEVPASPADPADENIEKILKAVSEQLDIPGLNEFVLKAQDAISKVDALEQAIKALSQERDEQLAEKISPAITKKMAWSRPSESDKNVANENDAEDKTLIKSGPKHWLAELANVEPVEV